MQEQDLPTWNDILGSTHDSLTTARESLGNARDHMHSDWRPVGAMLSDAEANARAEVLDLIGQAKGLIDQAQGVLSSVQR